MKGRDLEIHLATQRNKKAGSRWAKSAAEDFNSISFRVTGSTVGLLSSMVVVAVGILLFNPVTIIPLIILSSVTLAAFVLGALAVFGAMQLFKYCTRKSDIELKTRYEFEDNTKQPAELLSELTVGVAQMTRPLSHPGLDKASNNATVVSSVDVPVITEGLKTSGQFRTTPAPAASVQIPIKMTLTDGTEVLKEKVVAIQEMLHSYQKVAQRDDFALHHLYNACDPQLKMEREFYVSVNSIELTAFKNQYPIINSNNTINDDVRRIVCCSLKKADDRVEILDLVNHAPANAPKI